MAEIQENLHAGTSAQPFRIDQKLHQILYKSETRPALEPIPGRSVARARLPTTSESR